MALYLLWPQLPDLQGALQVMRQMPWELALLAVLLQVGSYWGSGYLLQSSVRIVGQRVSILRGVEVTLASNSISLLVGGILMSVAMTYRWLRSRGISQEGAGFACVLPWFFNNAFLLLVSIAGMIYLLVLHELSTLQVGLFVGASVVLGLFSLGVLGAMRYPDRLADLVHGAGRTYARLGRRGYDPTQADTVMAQLFAGLTLLRQGGWRAAFLGAVANSGLDALMLYVLFMAAGHPLSLGALLTGYGLPLLVGKIGFLPGGLGLVEASMGLIYGGLGVPKTVLVVVILIYRLLAFWIPTILGFLLVPYLDHNGVDSTA